MDQAQEILDVSPESGGPGIYDKLLPILSQWKSQYNFVGSFYADIGNNPPTQTTDWAKSGSYYKQILAMGSELGSHTITHPFNTNALTAAEIQSEFQGSRQIIEQQMSQILGRPFTVEGVAVPGNNENLLTAQQIIQYYDYMSGGFSGVGAGYPGAIGYLTPALAAQDKVYLAPNVEFDFTLVEFKGMTPAQASAEWGREWASLTSHTDVPVVVWPWHDYAATERADSPGDPSPYTTQMFTDFISRAYAAGAEFVTLADLADRISAFGDTTIRTSVSGSTVTATVTSTDAGRFALDLDNLGTQKIASVTGWYAYDADSVFLPRNGGTYTIQLGTAQTDVTHITALPMRADLLSLSGNGTNLNFSVFGEGKVLIDLINPTGKQLAVTGATISSFVGDQLALDLGAIGQHDVSVTLSGGNHAPTITSNGGGATAAISIAENSTAVTTVHATDADAGQTIAYSISGGADAAHFTINASTGALAFAAAPDFETPRDQGANNVYDVIVTARDSAGATDTQALAITVTNVLGVTLTGDSAANTLLGTAEADTLRGLGGDDALYGFGGNDSLYGSDGNENLYGGAGADLLDGGPGFDWARYDTATAAVHIDLSGATANTGDAAGDVFVAIEGVVGSPYADSIIGGAAADYLQGRNGDDTLQGRNGADTLVGGEGTDALYGDAGNDALYGEGGNDNLYGGAGADLFDGGAGFDWARYDTATAGVSVDLSRIIANTGDAAGDTFVAIEGIVGSPFADRIFASNGADSLQGRNGDDWIEGRRGNDTLSGGAGSDRFDYNSIADGVDLITDFTKGTGGDKLDVKDVLVGYNPASSNINNFVHLTGTASTTVLVNADGAGTDFVALATLQGVANSAGLLSDLLTHGNLIVS
jgi:Ca2+-binding RTX toxin-like protein